MEYGCLAGQLLMLPPVESDCVLVNAARYPVEPAIPTASASHAQPLRSELHSHRSELSNAAKMIDAISLYPLAIIRGCPVSAQSYESWSRSSTFEANGKAAGREPYRDDSSANYSYFPRMAKRDVGGAGRDRTDE